MRTLVAGWFSFEGAGATAGDLLARDLACEWLREAGHEYDVASASPFGGGVKWAAADPRTYSHVVFVCGPFFKSNLLQRFASCRLVGLNLSMAEPVQDWNPFDLLLERDSTQVSRPDITFLSDEPRVPVTGVVLLQPPDAVPQSGLYRRANDLIESFVAGHTMARLAIDTEIDIPNRSTFRTPAEVESLIRKTDVVITTRLHGMVLALKNGVPAIAVDPIPEGGKIQRQAEAVGWPFAYQATEISDEVLGAAFQSCMSEDTRSLAMRCGEQAAGHVAEIRDRFIQAMREPTVVSDWGDGRRRGEWLEPSSSSEVRVGGARRALLKVSRAVRARTRRRPRSDV